MAKFLNTFNGQGSTRGASTSGVNSGGRRGNGVNAGQRGGGIQRPGFFGRVANALRGGARAALGGQAGRSLGATARAAIGGARRGFNAGVRVR